MTKISFLTKEKLNIKEDGLTLHYGFQPTPFGECLIAITKRGVTALHFVLNGKREETLNSVMKEWKNATFLNSPKLTRAVTDRIFFSPKKRSPKRFELLVKGTPFQIKVWKELLRIPPGSVVSYQEIARRIGYPKSARAVGNAIAQNEVAYLIPCHRVIRKSGDFGKYRWGADKKKRVLELESGSLVNGTFR